jgi:hypothetical protein
MKCFKDILQRAEPEARDYFEANNFREIFVRCPFHYTAGDTIPHITVIVNDITLHIYATQNCRRFTNMTRLRLENIPFGFAKK